MKNFSMLLLVLLSAACAKAPDETPPAPSAAVEVAPAGTRTLHTWLTAYGTIEFSTSASQSLTLPYEARVAHVLVQQGQSVKKDQPLLELVPSAATELALNKAKRDADTAATDLGRVTRLRADGLATESELHAAQAAEAGARAQRDSLVAATGGGTLTLRSPQDGVVDSLTLAAGDMVASGSAVARIARADRLRVRLGLEAQDAARVRAGQRVLLAPLAAGAQEVEAHIDDVDLRVDAQTRLAAALVSVPDNAGLLAGSALRARIELAVKESALSVPRAALLYKDDAAYLYVAAGDAAHKRAVQTGISDGDFVEIVHGLAAGEGVITGGNYELEDGMAIRLPQAATADGKNQ